MFNGSEGRVRLERKFEQISLLCLSVMMFQLSCLCSRFNLKWNEELRKALLMLLNAHLVGTNVLVIYASAYGPIEVPFENFINYVTAMQTNEANGGRCKKLKGTPVKRRLYLHKKMKTSSKVERMPKMYVPQFLNASFFMTCNSFHLKRDMQRRGIITPRLFHAPLFVYWSYRVIYHCRK